jgi:hypothetical protein
VTKVDESTQDKQSVLMQKRVGFFPAAELLQSAFQASLPGFPTSNKRSIPKLSCNGQLSAISKRTIRLFCSLRHPVAEVEVECH